MQHQNPQKRVLNRREAAGWQQGACTTLLDEKYRDWSPFTSKGLPNNKDTYEGCLRVLSVHLTDLFGYPKGG